MYRDFDDLEFEPRNGGREREITLGPVLLTGLGVVLCAMCAGCFVLGYSVGHRGSRVADAPAAEVSEPVAPTASGQPKPAATQAVAAAPAPSAVESVAAGTGTAAGTAPVGASGGAVVQAALPVTGGGAMPGAAAGRVQAALGQGTPWMVQIAAVAHPEDADVLVAALRKRGYVVSARRDPADDLLHVQVGPFPTHADAAGMRQRLLNDGYNAIIEP